MKALVSLLLLASAVTLGGCGLTTPDFKVGDKGGFQTASYVNTVAAYVRCQLARSVYDHYYGPKDRSGIASAEERKDPQTRWLNTWTATVSLTLTVDDKATIAPNISIPEFLPTATKSFSSGKPVDVQRFKALGLGGSGVADAQRRLKLTWYEDFAELIEEADRGKKSPVPFDCKGLGAYPIKGDLKIDDSIFAGTLFTRAGLVSRMDHPTGPLQVIEHQVTFETQITGTVSPSIKLVEVTANTANNLFTGYRSEKNDLLISMGPAAQPDKPGVARAPSRAVLDSNLAAQIGQAVLSAINR